GDLGPLELMNVSDLVGVHKTGIAHHVATVCEVDRQHAAAPVLHARAAVIPKGGQGREKIATRIQSFDPLEKCWVDGNDVFEIAMSRTVLSHEDPACLLDDAGANLTGLAIDQRRKVRLSRQDLRADLAHADRTERVRFSWPAELGPRALALLEE